MRTGELFGSRAFRPKNRPIKNWPGVTPRLYLPGGGKWLTRKKTLKRSRTKLSDKVVENKPEEKQNELSDKVVEAKAEENLSEKVEIVKNGVTRIRMRSEVPGYIKQGWKLK